LGFNPDVGHSHSRRFRDATAKSGFPQQPHGDSALCERERWARQWAATERICDPTGKSKNLSSPFCKNILIFRRPKSPL
jgi:hypothetical protein